MKFTDQELETLLDATEKALEQNAQFKEDLRDLQQKFNHAGNPALHHGEPAFNVGRAVVESDAFKQMMSGVGKSCRVELKTAIINAVGQNQPLVPADRLAGIIHTPERRLTVRDLLPVARTTSNMVEYARENVYTNNAGPQVGGSPEAFENVAKPESGITYTLGTAAVTTLAHHIPVSKQVLSDSQALASYLNARLIYGLKLAEEQQLLNGTGSNGQLPGLYTNRTAYATTSPLSFTSKLDVLRDACYQVEAVDLKPSGIILNPRDWRDIETAKDNEGRYMFANPQNAAAPSLWGLPVVVTNTLAQGTFLVGDFQMAAQIWDREEAAVELGYVDSQFTKNMLTVLAEERLALAIYRPTGLVGGSFTL